MLPNPIRVATGTVVKRDGFWWVDLTPQQSMDATGSPPFR